MNTDPKPWFNIAIPIIPIGFIADTFQTDRLCSDRFHTGTFHSDMFCLGTGSTYNNHNYADSPSKKKIPVHLLRLFGLFMAAI
jgi:hypothetical protein